MALHDTAHRGQSDAIAREFPGGVQSREWLEQLASLRHVEAGAVVPYKIHRAVWLGHRAHLDSGRLPACALFHCIADEVLQQAANEVLVRPDFHPRLDRARQTVAPAVDLECLAQLSCHVTEIHFGRLNGEITDS